MSAQVSIVPLQVPLPKFGQVPTHPMLASESSSLPVPQILSLPPHAFATALWTLLAAFAIAGCA